jgi:hypothetical protein
MRPYANSRTERVAKSSRPSLISALKIRGLGSAAGTVHSESCDIVWQKAGDEHASYLLGGNLQTSE